MLVCVRQYQVCLFFMFFGLIAFPAAAIQRMEPIVLTKWSVAITAFGNAFLSGVIKSSEKGNQEWRNTSVIKERLCSTKLRTRTGAIYIIEGGMRRDRGQKGRAKGLYDSFKNGFPEDWKEIIHKHFNQWETNSSKDKTTIIQSAGTSINDNCQPASGLEVQPAERVQYEMGGCRSVLRPPLEDIKPAAFGEFKKPKKVADGRHKFGAPVIMDGTDEVRRRDNLSGRLQNRLPMDQSSESSSLESTVEAAFSRNEEVPKKRAYKRLRNLQLMNHSSASPKSERAALTDIPWIEGVLTRRMYRELKGLQFVNNSFPSSKLGSTRIVDNPWNEGGLTRQAYKRMKNRLQLIDISVAPSTLGCAANGGVTRKKGRAVKAQAYKKLKNQSTSDSNCESSELEDAVDADVPLNGRVRTRQACKRLENLRTADYCFQSSKLEGTLVADIPRTERILTRQAYKTVNGSRSVYCDLSSSESESTVNEGSLQNTRVLTRQAGKRLNLRPIDSHFSQPNSQIVKRCVLETSNIETDDFPSHAAVRIIANKIKSSTMEIKPSAAQTTKEAHSSRLELPSKMGSIQEESFSEDSAKEASVSTNESRASRISGDAAAHKIIIKSCEVRLFRLKLPVAKEVSEPPLPPRKPGALSVKRTSDEHETDRSIESKPPVSCLKNVKRLASKLQPRKKVDKPSTREKRSEENAVRGNSVKKAKVDSDNVDGAKRESKRKTPGSAKILQSFNPNIEGSGAVLVKRSGMETSTSEKNAKNLEMKPTNSKLNKSNPLPALTARPGTLRFNKQLKHFMALKSRVDNNDDDDFIDDSACPEYLKKYKNFVTDANEVDVSGVRTPVNRILVTQPVSAGRTPVLPVMFTPHVNKEKHVDSFIFRLQQRLKKKKGRKAQPKPPSANSSRKSILIESETSKNLFDVFSLPGTETDSSGDYYFSD